MELELLPWVGAVRVLLLPDEETKREGGDTDFRGLSKEVPAVVKEVRGPLPVESDSTVNALRYWWANPGADAENRCCSVPRRSQR